MNSSVLSDAHDKLKMYCPQSTERDRLLKLLSRRPVSEKDFEAILTHVEINARRMSGSYMHEVRDQFGCRRMTYRKRPTFQNGQHYSHVLRFLRDARACLAQPAL